MPLSEISYTTQQLALFGRLNETGAVLETVIMSPGKQVGDIYTCSKTAALKGMEILALRHAQPAEDPFRIQILPGEELAGTEISFASFIGNGFDPQTSTFQLAGLSPGGNNGLAYAISNPPYGLGTRKDNTPASELPHRLIKDYLEIILCVTDIKNTAHLEIYRWSDNWSNYFDQGKEWWGSFCWTIYNNQNNTVTFITASTTD